MADAEQLFALHRQGVLRYLIRVVGRPDTAQDLTQEVFLRVTRSQVPAADATGHRAWVFKIARNLVLNHLRDGRRRGEPLQLAEALSPAPATQEVTVAVREALESLQELDRDVFLLRESGGLTYAEIAETCDLTVEAVRARLRRAREELRVSLEGEIRRVRRSFVSLRSVVDREEER